MNIPKELGVKLSKENLPALVGKIKNGSASFVKMTKLRNGHPTEGWRSTLNNKANIDDAIAKLEKNSNIPENCGEVFVALA